MEKTAYRSWACIQAAISAYSIKHTEKKFHHWKKRKILV
jgi:hypothetical protein